LSRDVLRMRPPLQDQRATVLVQVVPPADIAADGLQLRMQHMEP
jgi:hypothetical protein